MLAVKGWYFKAKKKKLCKNLGQINSNTHPHFWSTTSENTPFWVVSNSCKWKV